MSVSSADVGTLYQKNRNGIAWSQPLGPGTAVYPQEANYIYDPPQNPIPPGTFFSESSGLWFAGCGHNFDDFWVFRDYDDITSSSVAIVACPLCSFIIQLIEPYEKWTDVNQFPIIVG